MSNLKIGDQVIMNGNYHVMPQDEGLIFTVASKPYKVCGVMLVKLKDRSGGYAVDGLSKVKQYKT